jgi:hypothetical protein
MKKYSIKNLLTVLRNPRAILGEVDAVGLKANRWYHRRFSENDGVHVATEEWDNLIILDGCRYDLFEAVNQLDGTLSTATSRGSTSVEFLDENFKGGTHHDTVYVTANPYAHKLDGDEFHRIYDLMKSDWDETEETVLPDRVVERTLEAAETHPNKRLIAHFMQPHYPFIGELGKEIGHRGYAPKQSDDEEGPHNDGGYRADYTVWGKLQYSLDGVTKESVWRAYRENLEIVLEEVEQLVEKLDGKTVITADHGNLVGERLSPIPVKGYGHPGYLRQDELVRVPWLELEYSSRRDVVAEPPAEESEQSKVDREKLEALGYIE